MKWAAPAPVVPSIGRPRYFLQAGWVRYGSATVAVALMFAFRAVLTPLWGQTRLPFTFFYPAILFAACFGGIGPALWAIVQSAILTDWFFLEPGHNLILAHFDDGVALVIFIGVCFCIAFAIEKMHRANARAQGEVEERICAEREIKELNASLDRRVRERTAELEAFAYTVAHDLRAPLRTMHGRSDVLLEDAGSRLTEGERDHLRSIAQAAGRMDALIQDLLAYSRLGWEKLTLDVVPLGPLVQEALQSVEPYLRARGAEVYVDPGMPLVVAHRTTLVQSVENLISNAAKFVAPGVTPRIRIVASIQGGWVRLVIEDNGIGIAPQYQGKIFGVFERLHTADVYPGTGIGLAIVRRAIERMGGRVGVESQEGQGSRFWCDVPLAESSSPSLPVTVGSPVSRTEDSHSPDEEQPTIWERKREP
jgi:signal transduction histidine kinase